RTRRLRAACAGPRSSPPTAPSICSSAACGAPSFGAAAQADRETSLECSSGASSTPPPANHARKGKRRQNSIFVATSSLRSCRKVRRRSSQDCQFPSPPWNEKPSTTVGKPMVFCKDDGFFQDEQAETSVDQGRPRRAASTPRLALQ